MSLVSVVNGQEYVVTVTGDVVKAQKSVDGKAKRGKPRKLNVADAKVRGFLPADFVPEIPLPLPDETPDAEKTGLPVEDNPAPLA